MTPSDIILHATVLALRCDGRWRGVLVRGPSGAGKSDLALRALEAGWRLVADDRSLVWMSGGQVFAKPPAVLAGLAEARGLGVMAVPHLTCAPVALVVEALPEGAAAPRTPDPGRVRVLQAELPCWRLDLREPSAVAKLGLALEAATAGRRCGPL